MDGLMDDSLVGVGLEGLRLWIIGGLYAKVNQLYCIAVSVVGRMLFLWLVFLKQGLPNNNDERETV